MGSCGRRLPFGISDCMITKQQYEVLRHTSQNGRYVTDEAAVLEMAAAGLLRDHGPQALAGGMHYLVTTMKGREAICEYEATLPKPKPLSRRKQLAKERMRRYREYGDGFRGFREFLAWDGEPERSWNR